MSDGPAQTPPTARKRAFLFTLGSGQLLTLVTMGVAFFATPVLLRHLGAERFGVWRVMDAWLGYVGILPQCLVLAAGFQLVPRLAQPAPVRLRGFLNGVWVVTISVAALTLAGALILVPALPHVAAVPAALEGERTRGFLLVVVTSAALAPFLVLRVVCDADQKGYWLNGVLAAQSLTTTGLAVWLAVVGWGLVGQGIAVAGGLAVHAGLLCTLVMRTYPWARPARPSVSEARAVVRGTSKLVVLGVLGGVVGRIEYPLVNALHGAETTAAYALSQRVFLIYSALVVGVGNALWAPLSDLYHRGDSVTFRARLEAAFLVTAALGFAGSVVVGAFTPAFLKLWVGDGFFVPGAGWAFAVMFPLLGLNSLLGWILGATQQNRAMLVSTGAYFAVGVGAATLLGRAGAAGVGWGLAIGLACSVFLNVWFLRKRFGVAPARLFAGLGMLGASALAYGAGLVGFVRAFPPRSWLELLFGLGAAWALYLTAVFWVLLPRDLRLLALATLVRRPPGHV